MHQWEIAAIVTPQEDGTVEVSVFAADSKPPEVECEWELLATETYPDEPFQVSHPMLRFWAVRACRLVVDTMHREIVSTFPTTPVHVQTTIEDFIDGPPCPN